MEKIILPQQYKRMMRTERVLLIILALCSVVLLLVLGLAIQENVQETGPLTTDDIRTVCMYGIGALVPAGCAVFRLVWLRSGYHQKPLADYCAAATNPEAMRQRLQALYEDTTLPGDLKTDGRLALATDGKGVWHVLETDRIVWVMPDLNASGFPCVVFITEDERNYPVYVSSRIFDYDALERAMRGLFDLLPQAVFGGEMELWNMFWNDRAAFNRLAAIQHTDQAERFRSWSIPSVPKTTVHKPWWHKFRHSKAAREAKQGDDRQAE